MYTSLMHSYRLYVPVQLAVSTPAALPISFLSVVVCVFTSVPLAYAGYAEALTLDIKWACRGGNVET